jgi:hypothetical protein
VAADSAASDGIALGCAQFLVGSFAPGQLFDSGRILKRTENHQILPVTLGPLPPSLGVATPAGGATAGAGTVPIRGL